MKIFNKLFLLVLLLTATSSYLCGQCFQRTAAGNGFSLAIKSDGTLWAWGLNASGQLGIGGDAFGNTSNSSSPVQVSAVTTWSRVAAGSSSSYAVRTDGTLWAWGSQINGALGNGLNVTWPRITPVQIGTDNNWLNVAAGDGFAFGIKTDGTLWAWGVNTYQQLGLNIASASVLTPTQVGTATNWVTVSAGSFHAAAINTLGELFTWGRNQVGQCGNGVSSATNVNVPTRVGTASNWRTVSCGEGHNVALTTANTVWCWGWNGSGQIGSGLGTTINTLSPFQVSTATTWAHAAAGGRHTLAILANGNIWGWGSNASMQIVGTSATIYEVAVQASAATTPWTVLSAGANHNSLITNTGQLWSNGSNVYGNLGNGTISNMSGYVAINCPASTLPVTITQFSADNNRSMFTNLFWNTGQEINNKGFYVEQSVDGFQFYTIHFEPSKLSAGEYRVAVPKAAAKKVYYRLQQVDRDGKFSFSSIVYVENIEKSTVQVFPTLAQSQIFVSGLPNVTKYEITNTSGLRILAGYTLGNISLHNVPSGTYILTLETTSGKQPFRFVKL
jgi:alpha-tubulin suppressor-like RCC1 family protein